MPHLHPLGYFNAYGVAAHNVTPDIFVHLGDYVCSSLYPLSLASDKLGRFTNPLEMGQ